jgi:hypothetical protein
MKTSTECFCIELFDSSFKCSFFGVSHQTPIVDHSQELLHFATLLRVFSQCLVSLTDKKQEMKN